MIGITRRAILEDSRSGHQHIGTGLDHFLGCFRIDSAINFKVDMTTLRFDTRCHVGNFLWQADISLTATVGAGPDSELGLALARVRQLFERERGTEETG